MSKNLSYCQAIQTADSLIFVLETTKIDTVKVNVLESLCKEKCKYGEFALAKKYSDDALALAQKIGYQNGIAAAYNQVGMVNWYLQNSASALIYHQKALAIYQQLNDSLGIAYTMHRIGHAYFGINKYNDALVYFQWALKLCKQIKDLPGVSKNLDLIGFVYMNLFDYEKALTYYFEAIKLAQQIENNRLIAAINHDIAVVYEKQNKLSQALTYASHGLSLAEEIGEQKLLEEAYTGIEVIYLSMNNYKEAYNVRIKLDQLKVALSNAENISKIKQMQMHSDFERKVVSDSLQFVNEKAIEQIKLQKQKAYTYLMMFASIIITILLIFAYRNYHKQRVTNKILKETQQKLIQGEKNAAFGVMASRVSHEIQNPLTFVNNFSELSMDLVDDAITATNEADKKANLDLLLSNLHKINEHGKRASEIVKQLQTHSNKGTAQEFFDKAS